MSSQTRKLNPFDMPPEDNVAETPQRESRRYPVQVIVVTPNLIPRSEAESLVRFSQASLRAVLSRLPGHLQWPSGYVRSTIPLELDVATYEWLRGDLTTICRAASDREHLLETCEMARSLGVPSALIEEDEDGLSVAAIGPAYPEVLGRFLDSLQSL